MIFRFSPEGSACGFVLATAATISSIQPGSTAGQDIQVLMDQATMLRLERPAAEIVVGNPSIADVSVQSDKAIVLTGKSFGETNLIMIDPQGKVVINRRSVPAGLTEANSSVIVAEVTYKYTGLLGLTKVFNPGSYDMKRTFYARPRKSADVAKTDNGC